MILAATGHRPNKLGGYGEEVFQKLVSLAETVQIEKKPKQVLSGMALGWDMAWAQAAINLGIPFTACIPFLGQEKMWPLSSQEKYNSLLQKAAEVLYICDAGYAPWKMQIRNEYMVDHCDLVVALWNGSTGGTGNCVSYAKKKQKPIYNVWDKFND